MIRDKLQLVPKKPGSYQMKDAYGNIIYVGKAKNLKNRLTTYFTGSHDHKTTKMISHIDDFEYIITNTELEALILEIDLIKKYQPRYNILLTDDKSYPYIEITKERHPKLIVSRTLNKTNKDLFGPYPNAKAARDTVNLLNKLYPLRKCYKLPNEPCLYYYLGQCLAPCIKTVEKTTYNTIRRDITQFLKGNINPVIKDLETKMQDASNALEFERAKEYKDTIDAIKTTTKKQSVNLTDLTDRDMIAIAYDDNHVALEIFFVRNGKIAAREHRLMPYYIDPFKSVRDYLIQFYETYPIPKEIYTNQADELDYLPNLFKTTLKTPKRGEKKKLLDLALLNAKQNLETETKHIETQNEKTFGALDSLAELLDIPTPYHIEAFDNSHLFGSYPVSSMVVFKNATPSKRDYRKYKLNTDKVQSGDTEQMEEVLYRRYYRMLVEDQPKPDLILVDGGIHQLNAAKTILRGLDLTIPVAGMVKSQDHKTHHLIDMNDNELELDPRSKVFKLLSYIQEEAHRFAINYHKSLRAKGMYATILDNIEGVGEITKKKLLNHFKTISAMQHASEDAFLELSIPKQTIKNIKAALNQTKNR